VLFNTPSPTLSWNNLQPQTISTNIANITTSQHIAMSSFNLPIHSRAATNIISSASTHHTTSITQRSEPSTRHVALSQQHHVSSTTEQRYKATDAKKDATIDRLRERLLEQIKRNIKLSQDNSILLKKLDKLQNHDDNDADDEKRMPRKKRAPVLRGRARLHSVLLMHSGRRRVSRRTLIG